MLVSSVVHKTLTKMLLWKQSAMKRNQSMEHFGSISFIKIIKLNEFFPPILLKVSTFHWKPKPKYF